MPKQLRIFSRVTHIFQRALLRSAAVCCAGAIAGCSVIASSPPSAPASVEQNQTALPPIKHFTNLPIVPVTRSNQDIARDFVDLSFGLENGTKLSIFTRFEGPVHLRVIGEQIPQTLQPDLDNLLVRLRQEAGIDINQIPSTQTANITIQTLPREQLNRQAPNTACIVIPNVTNWSGFLKANRSDVNWAALKTRQTMSIFIPQDESPQEIRDCLHEELAQALGPLNDLYRLPDSVFNDDNVHSILTGFDMLMLRLTYDPALKSGMSQAEVAGKLPQLLLRLNPQGEQVEPQFAPASPREWIDDIILASGAARTNAQRFRAAERAALRATAEGWQDTRTGLSLFLLGLLAAQSEVPGSEGVLNSAQEIFDLSPNTRYHSAQIALPLASLALSRQEFQTALTLTEKARPAAMEAGNAVLLSSLLFIQAEALRALGQVGEAQTVRLDSLGWARYGFGSNQQVRARANDIAALAHPSASGS